MIPYIQVLRFVAAMWVAIYHAINWTFFPSLPAWIHAVAEGGYAGVDIFFVISGVIMALVTRDSPSGITPAFQFVLTRFARIYTGWWPALLLFYLSLTLIKAIPPSVDMLSSALLYPSNLTFHISGVIWTLMYELYFYLIVGASLFLPKRWRDTVLALAGLAILAFVLQHWFANNYAPEGLTNASYSFWFFAAPIVLEFFAGYFLYRWLSKKPQQDWRLWAAATIVLACLATYVGRVSMVPGTSLAQFYFWPERAFFMGLAACALVGTAILAPPFKGAYLPWLVKLGDCSFAIYLLHPLLYTLANKPLQWINPEHHHRWLMMLAVMAALLTASALYYRYIEHPIYQACRRRIRQWLDPIA